MEELARIRRKKMGQGANHAQRDSNPYPLEMSLAELEKQHILGVLDSVGNNQRAAAKILGINPSTLWRKLKAYGLNS
jgi:DNA-binding protein Fis